MKQFDIFFDSQNNAYQVRTKSDTLVFEFSDSDEEKIFLSILKMYEKEDIHSFAQIREELKTYNQSKVLDVVQELQKCSLLNSSNYTDVSTGLENQKGSFAFWHGLSPIPSDCKICFVGHQQLGKCFLEKAQKFGYTKVDGIWIPNEDFSEKRLKEISNLYDFYVMDAYYWNPRLLSLFNQLMLEQNKPWIFIDGMIDSNHYSIGPLFHGEETGCYECLESRIASNDYNKVYTDAYRNYLLKHNAFSKNNLCAFPYDDIVANIVLLDINKYILGIGVLETWKNVLLFDTTSYSITKHYFLKNPLCIHCNPKIQYAYSPWLEMITLNK